jgi:hypothetical protein
MPCVDSQGTDADLTPEYVAALRRLSGRQKVKAGFDLYWAARALKTAALRKRHPDWTDAQIEDRVKEIFLHAGS